VPAGPVEHLAVAIRKALPTSSHILADVGKERRKRIEERQNLKAIAGVLTRELKNKDIR
jgi:hypothetical protein